MNGEPACGRHPDPDGPFDRRLDVQITQEMEEALIVASRLHGFQNRSELVRDVLHRWLFGEMHRIESLVRRGSALNPGNRG